MRVETKFVSTGLRQHPLTVDLFPPMDDAAFEALVDDIRAHGQHEPVVLYEGAILDGYHRYRACEVLGVEPTFAPYTDDNPVAYVVSANLRRRHLDESQRAMVAARLASFGHGGDRSKSPIGDLKQADAAKLLNVGKRSVERAREVLDHGTPELAQAVACGEVSVSAAAEVATLPVPEQREVIADGAKAVRDRAKEIRDAHAKRSAAAKKGAEKAAETRRRKREEKQEAMIRELEVNKREMGELASRLIALDRAVAHAVYEAMSNWSRRDMFEYALEEGLGLIEEIPDDEQDDTSDDTPATERADAVATSEPDADWSDSDDVKGAAA